MVGAVVLAVAAAGACRSNDAAPAVDASSIGPADGRRDSASETRVENPNCETARSICIGSSVFECVGNGPGQLLHVCPASCSLGRCTTASCAQAQIEGGLQGCLFYGVQSDNIDEDDGRNLMLVLNNSDFQPVDAVIEVPGLDGSWSTLASGTVPATGGARIAFSRPVLDVGVTTGGAFRVQTSAPVMAVQIVSDDSDKKSRSSAGTVLRPVQALGRHYIALTAPARSSGTVVATPGSRGGAGAITVIATAPSTHLELRLTGPVMMQPGGLLDPPPLAYEVPPLEEGDVLQIFSTDPDRDLTGTSIRSDVPVAVFTGNIFTSYGYDLAGFHGGDLAQEQLPPTTSWGFEYVGARLSPQLGCDPFFGTGVGLWQVVAAENDTRVTILPAPQVSVDWPGLSGDLKFTLPAGGSQSFWSRGNLKISTASDVVVRADKPILLAQWLDCEPGLAWGIDTGLLGGSLWFNLPPGFEHEVVVVKRANVPLEFDEELLAESEFTLASPDGQFKVARLGPARLGMCQEGGRCDHHLVGAGFGVSWRGMDVVCSYALTVPPGHFCALPNVECPP